MDAFDHALREQRDALKRAVGILTRDVDTLLEALTKHEGHDICATCLRHLGRTPTDRPRAMTTHPTTTEET